MPKIRVGDIVFYRNWRLGNDVFLARVANVKKKKGLVTLVPFYGKYGSGWTWGGKPLPVIVTTSMDIFREEPVWLAMSESDDTLAKRASTETMVSEMQEKLKGIGEGSPSEYDSLTSIEEAEELIEAVTKA